MVKRVAGHHGNDLVAFTNARPFHGRQPADALDPAVARQDHVGIFPDDVRLRVKVGRIFVRGNPRAAAVVELLAQLAELVLDHAP